MNSVGRYLLTVSAAAIICSSIRELFRENTKLKSIMYLITGIFMITVLLFPVLNWNPAAVSKYMSNLDWEQNRYTAEGQEKFISNRNSLIIKNAETYILNKASEMDADIDVKVTLSSDNPPVPQGVVIKGAVSPFTKQALEKEIVSQLGISKENQKWIHSP